MRNRLFISSFIVAAAAFLSLSDRAQAQFTYSTNADGATLTITGYSGPGGAVEIPGDIHGRAITAIGDFAFARHPEVTSVTMPDGITSIGEGAFTCVDSYASLTNVTLGNGVTSIGPGGFCVLQPVDGHDDSGGRDEHRQPRVHCVFWPDRDHGGPEQRGVQQRGRSVVQQIADGAHPIPGGRRGNFTIPDSVTNLERFALWNCQKLTGVTIPEGITEIKPEAFAACYSLTNVVVPGSVTYIGGNAFDSCVSLRGIYFHGNAPGHSQYHAFNGAVAVVYYLPGTTGWDATFDGLPTAMWKQ